MLRGISVYMGERERHTKAKEESKRFLFVLLTLFLSDNRLAQFRDRVNRATYFGRLGGRVNHTAQQNVIAMYIHVHPTLPRILYFAIMLTTLFSEVSTVHFLVF